MNRTLLRSVYALVAGVLLFGGAQEARAAQDWVFDSREGYIGIDPTLMLMREGRGLRTVLRVDRVQRRSPADEAGLQRGDLIYGLNGRPMSSRLWAEFRAAGIEPGDEVRLTVRRDNELREVLVEAAERELWDEPEPEVWRLQVPKDIQTDLETLQGLVRQSIEEAQRRFVEEEHRAVEYLRSDSSFTDALRLMRDARGRNLSFSLRRSGDDDQTTWVFTTPDASVRFQTGEVEVLGESFAIPDVPQVDGALEIRAPLPPAAADAPEVIVMAPEPRQATSARYQVRSLSPFSLGYTATVTPKADSLRSAYIVMRSELAKLEELRHERENELYEAARAQVEQLSRADDEMRRLERSRRQLTGRLADIESRLRDVELAERVAVEEQRVVVREELHDAPHVPEIEEVPVGGSNRVLLTQTVSGVSLAPLPSRISARVVGQNMVMGAQILPLNDELASYFEVEDGVLIAEVFGGTPAARAGILPGDVIIRAGRHDIHGVDDLRRALAEGRSGIRFRIVRKGETLTVRLR